MHVVCSKDGEDGGIRVFGKEVGRYDFLSP